jgi:hypothetical protein
MKSKIVILFLLVASITHGQTIEKLKSNAEIFSTKSGTLIKKEFVDIGKVKDAKVSVIHYTDMIDDKKVSSVNFKYEHTSKYSKSTKSASLDADEIEGLIKSIKLIQEKIFSTTPDKYTEVSFFSRSGFSAGCYWSSDKWKTYIRLEKFDSDSYVFLQKEDFKNLLELLEKAKTKL